MNTAIAYYNMAVNIGEGYEGRNISLIADPLNNLAGFYSIERNYREAIICY